MKTLLTLKHISGVEEYAVEEEGRIEFRVRKDNRRKAVDPDFCAVPKCRNETDTVDRGIPLCTKHLAKEYALRDPIEKTFFEEGMIPAFVDVIPKRKLIRQDTHVEALDLFADDTPEEKPEPIEEPEKKDESEDFDESIW